MNPLQRLLALLGELAGEPRPVRGNALRFGSPSLRTVTEVGS